jgi:NADPH:quinone reductase-like Zn-dependent oxidoreductase
MHNGRSSPGKVVVRVRMRAVMFAEKAKPAYLSYKTVPQPKDNQVLLEVIAASLNPVDWKILYYNWTGLTLPAVLGCDVSGVVRSVGKDVKDYKTGDQVFGTLNLWDVGSYAENCVIETTRLAKIGKVSFETAASLPVVFLSAWEAFIKPEVKKLLEDKKTKHTVYIAGGGGGVGHMAVQIAKHFGFTVISSGSREDSLNVIKASGADHIIDYKKEDVVKAVHKIVGEAGVDMIFDSTYQQSSFVQSAKVIKAGGLYTLLGGAPEKDSETAKIVAEKKAHLLLADLVPYAKADAKTMQEHFGNALATAIKLIEEKALKPHVSMINLDDVPKALEDFKANGAVGKIVVKVKGVH